MNNNEKTRRSSSVSVRDLQNPATSKSDLGNPVKAIAVEPLLGQDFQDVSRYYMDCCSSSSSVSVDNEHEKLKQPQVEENNSSNNDETAVLTVAQPVRNNDSAISVATPMPPATQISVRRIIFSNSSIRNSHRHGYNNSRSLSTTSVYGSAKLISPSNECSKRIIMICILVLMLIAAASTMTVLLYRNYSIGYGDNSVDVKSYIAGIVGQDVLSQPAYKLALDWIVLNDPLQLTIIDEGFIQRFILAYFYYSTTNATTQQWNSCNPPVKGQTDFCTYNHTIDINSVDNDPVNDYYSSRKNLQATPRSSYRWLSIQSECYWRGVSCNEQGQIQSIVLDSTDLVGTFPEGIMIHLPYIQYLALPNNNLSGTLPTDISMSLRKVDLSGNKFTGGIPWTDDDINNLEYLMLSNNALSGTFPDAITKMSNLDLLDLSENQFDGPLPTSISSLSLLSVLDLSENSFDSMIPTEIGSFTDLTILNVNNNKFVGSIPTEMGKLSKLSRLSLSSNALTGAVPEDIFRRLPYLKELVLASNQLSTMPTFDTAVAKQLQVLDLSYNNFVGLIGANWLSSPYLTQVKLHGNNFRGMIPTLVCELDAIVKADCLGDLPQVYCDCCKLCCSGAVCAVPVHHV